MKSNIELQLALAKMLPEKIQIKQGGYMFDWCDEKDWTVQETEWLHVCHLIEQKLPTKQLSVYFCQLRPLVEESFEPGRAYVYLATWQQRAEALIKIYE